MTLHGKKRERGKGKGKEDCEVFTGLIYMPDEQQLEIVPELNGLE